MIARYSICILAACLLSACASHEGVYSPACAAFAGSSITLHDGRFVWEKFTDSVIVDDDGKTVNQFPGYPMQGSYSIDGGAVEMESSAGESLATMYLHRHNRRQYLLTAEQHAAWKEHVAPAACALVLD